MIDFKQYFQWNTNTHDIIRVSYSNDFWLLQSSIQIQFFLLFIKITNIPMSHDFLWAFYIH